MPEFIVPEALSNISIKDFLRRHIGLSLTAWRKTKNGGTLTINGNPALPSMPVQAGDIIYVHWQDECTIPATDIPLKILYEDDYLLVINKPAGMLVHPAKHNDTETLANALMHYYQQEKLLCGFHPIHRLDRNTSGAVLISKYPHIQHLLSLNNIKQVKRIYWGVAEGFIKPPIGIIDMPIGRHPDSIIERMVRSDGQQAITNYRVLKKLTAASLVELELLTGRTHQIRVHLSYIGHPLLGDDLYGGSLNIISRQALHSARLCFKHPATSQIIDISCPLPNDLQELIDSY